MDRVHRRFAQVEDLQETAKYWDLDFRQMDRGSFAGEIQIATTPEVQLVRVHLTRRIEQAGAPPPGLRTIAVPADPDLRMFWRGRLVTGQDTLVYPLGSEIDVVSQPGFYMYVLSFAPEVLANACEALEIADVNLLLNGSDVVRADPRILTTLRQSLAAWFLGGPAFDTNEACSWARTDLPRTLVALLASASSTRSPGPVLRMDRAIRLARDHVAASPEEAMRVSDICRDIGVSERTLRHAFRNRLGVTPKAYLRDRRLNLARSCLRHANPNSTKVLEVANQYGFWHLGQFAADYRRLFKELPSATLSRPPS